MTLRTTLRAGRFVGRLVPVKDLSPEERPALLDVYRGLYAEASEQVFFSDLAKKDSVILLEQEERLVGFSSVKILRHEWEGGCVGVVYSGDTAVDPSAWASLATPRLWTALAMGLREEIEAEHTYWLLLAGSPRTYRFLPLLFERFFPRFGEETPPGTRALMASIAHRLFGSCYHPERGIVRFSQAPRLRRALAERAVSRSHDPHLAFYLDAAPGFEEGDELVCLAELSRENLSPAGRRMMR